MFEAEGGWSLGKVELEQGPGGRLDVRGARRRQVIAAVRTMIARSGISSVTIANIAMEMHVSRGVIDYHFDTKESILHEVLQVAIRDAVNSSTPGESRPEDLSRLVLSVCELASTDSDWWPIYAAYLAMSHDDPFYRDEIRNADLAFKRALQPATGTPERAAAVLSIMKGIALQRLVDESLDVKGIVEQFKPFLEP